METHWKYDTERSHDNDAHDDSYRSDDRPMSMITAADLSGVALAVKDEGIVPSCNRFRGFVICSVLRQ